MLPDSILIDEITRNWKEVMDHFREFTEALTRFQQINPDMPIDYLGPELQLVYQAGLQRKKPVWVIEHLEMELTQKGTLSHLTPREPEPEEPVESVEQPEEEQVEPSEEAPLEPEGGKTKEDAPDSPKKESTAQVAGELKEELG
jgi:hypothetical protein